MGVGYPEADGGSGGGALALSGGLHGGVPCIRRGVSLTPIVSKLGVIPLMLAGTDERRRCRNADAGDVLMSYALTEAGAGSDAAAMATRFQRDGDHVVLSGTKRFITGAGVSHAYLVFATSDPALRAEGPLGVPRDAQVRAPACRSASPRRRWASRGGRTEE